MGSVKGVDNIVAMFNGCDFQVFEAVILSHTTRDSSGDSSGCDSDWTVEQIL